jgi:uncharacterized protein YraI
MKFIGLPKKSRSAGEGLRTALGSGLLIVVVLVCIMGAESVLSANKPSSLTDPSETAPSTDMLASIDGEQSVPSLVDRTEETVATTVVPTVTETTVTEPTEPTAPPITETAEAATYYVTAEINLRSGPGTEYESIGTFARGEAITVVASTSNGWKKLGEGKYVISDYLSTSVPETAKSGTYYATGSINVRSGPGTEYDVVKTLSVGSAIEITAVTSNGWYRTVKDTYVNVKVCSSTPPATPTPKPTPKPTAKPTPTPKPIPEGVAEMAAAVGLSAEEFELFAKVVNLESNGSYEGQQWIAEVIWNRINSGNFGSGVYGVLTVGQFSVVNNSGTGTKQSRNAVVYAYQNEVIPANVLYFWGNKYPSSDPTRQYGECGGNYFCTS